MTCWLPVCLLCMPGNIMWDTGSSIGQFLGIVYVTPNNPYFLNFFYGSVAYLGKLLGSANIAVFVYCLLQSALFIWLLSDMIAYIGERSAWAGYILLLLYGLAPIFPVYSMSMAKDTSLAAALLIYLTLTLRAVAEPGFLTDSRNMFRVGMSIVLISLVRNQAGWLPAVILLLYAVFVSKQRTVIVSSAAVVLAVAFFTVFLPRALLIPRGELRENMSAPLQTMAHYAMRHPEDMTDEDKQIISCVIDYDTMIAKYDPEISDPIKNIAVFDQDTTGPFITLWFSKFMKHPDTMAEGFYKSTHVYLVPGEESTSKPHVTIGFDVYAKTKEYLGLSNVNPNLNTLRAYVRGWLDRPGLRLLVTIGLYTVILLCSLLLMLVFKNGRYILCLGPLMMVLVGCLFSPVNGYFRYAYAMIAGVPVLFADMLVTIVGQAKEKKLRLIFSGRGKKQKARKKARRAEA